VTWPPAVDIVGTVPQGWSGSLLTSNRILAVPEHRAQSLDVEVLPELAHCLDFGRVLRLPAQQDGGELNRMARQALVGKVGVEMGAQHSGACSTKLLAPAGPRAYGPVQWAAEGRSSCCLAS
jgi:hypothetical protein